ncbi:hypothetical protein ABC345_18110 [Shouchella sp. 1P09AA]|uniref:hypothetical protein n=1 Tax=unclassified Shouchella TaxID=2893065 RepID=UPI0039A1998B
MRFYLILFALVSLAACNQSAEREPLRIDETEQATTQVWKEASDLGEFETGPVWLSIKEMSVLDVEWHVSFIVDGLDSPKDSYIYVDFDLTSEVTNEELAFDTNHVKVKINGEETLEEIERQVSNTVRMDLITERLINRRMYFPLETIPANEIEQVDFIVEAPLDENEERVDDGIIVEDVFQ